MQSLVHEVYQVSSQNLNSKLNNFELYLPESLLFFYSGLENLQGNRRVSLFFQSVNLSEMVMCLEDLILYFCQPEDDMGKFLFLLDP